MSTARAAFYFLGLVLLVLAAVSIGRQLAGGEAPDWTGPCLLALVGVGSLGMGIFSNIESVQDDRGDDPRADGGGDCDIDAGGD